MWLVQFADHIKSFVHSYQAWELTALIPTGPWYTADYVKHLELKLWKW